MAHPKRVLIALRALFALALSFVVALPDTLRTAVRDARSSSPRELPHGTSPRHTGLAGIFADRHAPSYLQWAPRTSKTGTMSIADLRAARFQSVAKFGQDTISDVFQADLAVHQAIMADILGPIADFSSDRQRIQGSSDAGQMYEADEFGRAPTQKVVSGTTVGFPMRNYQYAIGWTRKYLKNAKVGELLDQYTASKKAHAKTVSRELKRAMYRSANYTWRDMLVDNVDLSVKRFVNADSAPIADGPNGELYDGTTHTHYDGVSSLSASNLQTAIRDVVEHGFGGKVVTVISITDEATVRALTGFVPYVDPRVTLNTAAREAEKRLDITRLDNRAIGIFDSSEIWLKPWGIASYALTFDSSSPSKPLVVRTRDGKAPTLDVAANIDTFPLQAEYMESEFGIGVWNRTNGGVLYFASASYADPTIN